MPLPLRVAFGAFPVWEALIRPRLDPAHYAAGFHDLAEADLDRFDAVVPLTLDHYRSLAARDDLRGCKFHAPSAEVVALCHDKLALNRFLVAEGFGDLVPRLRDPGPPYPYVWKRRRGGWGWGIQLVDSAEAERGLDLAHPNWFAQAAVAGTTEYATHMLRVGGRLRYVSTFTHGMGEPLAVLGARRSARTVHFKRGCEHVAVFEAILARLDYEGTACFDYKLEAGQPRLFEINPRYGGTLNYDVSAYVAAYVAALRPA